VSNETHKSVKSDATFHGYSSHVQPHLSYTALKCQKRPTKVSNETHKSVKRDPRPSSLTSPHKNAKPLKCACTASAPQIFKSQYTVTLYSVCVCVYVCMRERERERGKERVCSKDTSDLRIFAIGPAWTSMESAGNGGWRGAGS